MTCNVVTCPPEAGILDMVHLLELHQISAMPVVENGLVRGMVSADLLAKKSLAKLLQTQI
jgi:predicted transcriptional regulator